MINICTTVLPAIYSQSLGSAHRPSNVGQPFTINECCAEGPLVEDRMMSSTGLSLQDLDAQPKRRNLLRRRRLIVTMQEGTVVMSKCMPIRQVFLVAHWQRADRQVVETNFK
jgi:hypothetical protein